MLAKFPVMCRWFVLSQLTQWALLVAQESPGNMLQLGRKAGDGFRYTLVYELGPKDNYEELKLEGVARIASLKPDRVQFISRHTPSVRHMGTKASVFNGLPFGYGLANPIPVWFISLTQRNPDAKALEWTTTRTGDPIEITSDPYPWFFGIPPVSLVPVVPKGNELKRRVEQPCIVAMSMKTLPNENRTVFETFPGKESYTIQFELAGNQATFSVSDYQLVVDNPGGVSLNVSGSVKGSVDRKLGMVTQYELSALSTMKKGKDELTVPLQIKLKLAETTDLADLLGAGSGAGNGIPSTGVMGQSTTVAGTPTPSAAANSGGGFMPSKPSANTAGPNASAGMPAGQPSAANGGGFMPASAGGGFKPATPNTGGGFSSPNAGSNEIGADVEPPSTGKTRPSEPIPDGQVLIKINFLSEYFSYPELQEQFAAIDIKPLKTDKNGLFEFWVFVNGDVNKIAKAIKFGNVDIESDQMISVRIRSNSPVSPVTVKQLLEQAKSDDPSHRVLHRLATGKPCEGCQEDVLEIVKIFSAKEQPGNVDQLLTVLERWTPDMLAEFMSAKLASKKSSTLLRHSIIRRLGKIQDEESIDLLIKHLQTGNDTLQVRMELEKCESRIESKLWPLLRTKNDDVRRAVCHILGEIGTEQSRSKLFPTTKMKEGGAASAAKQAIARIAERKAGK